MATVHPSTNLVIKPQQAQSNKEINHKQSNSVIFNQSNKQKEKIYIFYTYTQIKTVIYRNKSRFTSITSLPNKQFKTNKIIQKKKRQKRGKQQIDPTANKSLNRQSKQNSKQTVQSTRQFVILNMGKTFTEAACVKQEYEDVI